MNKKSREDETKAIVRQLVTNDLTRLIEEAMDNMLRTWYHNDQNEIRSIVYNVTERVKLDLLRNDVTGEVLHAHTTKFTEIDAAEGRLSKKPLTSGSFTGPISTFV